jgi:CRISPR/Cas system-associated protein Cas10 (large subunit of type III CRISPR-Cas system)
MTVLEQLKKLDEQRAKLIEDAKASAMKKVQEGIDDLTAIGFMCKLVEIKDDEPAAKKRASTQKPAAERHCDICDIMGHDARAHRNQEPKKKFTQKELLEKGLA